MKSITYAMVVALAAIACGAPSQQSQLLYGEYQRVATYPLGPFGAGDAFQVTWTAKQIQPTTSAPYDLRLCVGIFGPYASVEALKQSHSTTAECAPAGAVAASETTARSDDGRVIAMDLKLPSAPGFYDVVQIQRSGSGAKANGQSGAGVIEVRAR